MAHAKLSPSASKRWVNCPGSVRMSAGIPTRTTSYAEEGTAAHALREHCMKHGYAAERFAGWAVDVKEGSRARFVEHAEAGGSLYEVNDEMVNAVQLDLDTIRAEIRPGDEWDVEQRVRLSDDIWGTSDFVRYRPSTHHLLVEDFKYGRGVAVTPQENTQGIIYALGAAKAKANRGLRTVEIVIVQPRCPHPDGPVRRWELDVLDLLDWEADILAAAERTRAPDAPLKAGDWCQFCPAAGVCPTLREQALAVARADFTEAGSILLPEPTAYDAATLAATLKEIDLVEDWCRRVREFAHHEAEAGRCPPGFKLVPTRPTRKWKDAAAAEKWLRGYGLDDADLFDRKFRSPAAIDKVLKKDKGAIADLVEKTSGGTVVAPLDDPRAPVRAEAANDFM